jgi:hypothetical protein
MARFWLLSLCVLLLCTCQPKEKPQPPQRAFYHWKSEFVMNRHDSLYLSKLGVRKMYVHYFDVVWNAERNAATPTARLQIQSRFPKNIICVPVVYITVEALKKLAHDTLTTALAQKIAGKINGLHQQLKAAPYSEIQIDCDWTASTQKRYFLLLKNLRKNLKINTKISATVRLHQVKFLKKQGIPPADRALLMCYNMASVANIRTQNSIFDAEICKQYLENLADYPLPTDIALPLFSWAVIFRDKHYRAVAPQISEAELLQNPNITLVAPHWFEVKKATIIDGVVLEAHDQIRTESVDSQELYAFTEFLQAHTKPQNRSLVFFHYAPEVLQQHTPPTLEKIWNLEM